MQARVQYKLADSGEITRKPRIGFASDAACIANMIIIVITSVSYSLGETIL